VTMWDLPFTMSTAGDLGFQSGYVFLTDNNAAILQFNPATNGYRKWTLPLALVAPRDFAFDGAGNVYFSVSSINTAWIGRLNYARNTFTVWTVPSGLAAPLANRVEDVAIDSSGNVFFAVMGAGSPPSGNKIGRLNPANNVFTAWSIPNTPNFA